MQLDFKFKGILSDKLSLLFLFIIPIIFGFPTFSSEPSGSKAFLSTIMFVNKSRTGKDALLISSNIIIFLEFFSSRASEISVFLYSILVPLSSDFVIIIFINNSSDFVDFDKTL